MEEKTEKKFGRLYTLEARTLRDFCPIIVEEALYPYDIFQKWRVEREFVYLLLNGKRETRQVEDITYKEFDEWSRMKYTLEERRSFSVPEYFYAQCDVDIDKRHEWFTLVWVNLTFYKFRQFALFRDEFLYDFLGRILCRVFGRVRSKGNVEAFTEEAKACIRIPNVLPVHAGVINRRMLDMYLHMYTIPQLEPPRRRRRIPSIVRLALTW